ncbi:MAG: cupin domain-containing protein [Methyloligella sp. ZOD6]
MPTKVFDERNIDWHPIDGFDHILYHVCRVDEENGIVDVLFKFDAESKIAVHRHMVDYCTLVLQGELRIYSPEGSLREIRPVGSYVCTRGGGEPHTEGGGDQEAIVFFSNRNVKNIVYEILDESRHVITTLGIPEFKAFRETQKTALKTAV